MSLAQRMSDTIRANISLITGISMPLILIFLSIIGGVVLKNQWDMGHLVGSYEKMAEAASLRRADIDRRLDTIRAVDQAQHDAIQENRDTIRDHTNRLDALDQRLQQYEKAP